MSFWNLLGEAILFNYLWKLFSNKPNHDVQPGPNYYDEPDYGYPQGEWIDDQEAYEEPDDFDPTFDLSGFDPTFDDINDDW